MSSNLWLTPSAIQARDRVVYDRGVDIFPDYPSDTPEMFATLRAMASDLTKLSTSTQDKWGITDHNGLTGDFWALHNAAGHPMINSNYPPISNAKLREELGLSNHFVSARHEAIFRAVHKAMFSSWSPRAARIARISSTCSPHFQKDVKFKLQMANHLFQNVGDVIAKWNKGDLEGLFRDHRFMASYYLVARMQPDKITRREDGTLEPKAREYNDFEYALTGGARGFRGPSSKELIINGQPILDFFRVRRRTAYGMSAMANYLWLAVIDGFRLGYFTELAPTVKHRGIPDLNDKISRFSFAFGTDVKQYDQSVPSFMIDAFVDWMPVKDSLKPYLRDLFSAPYYAPPQMVGEDPPGKWMGNPLKRSNFKLEMGLPSGISPNSDFGKWSNISAYLCALDDIGGNISARGEDNILRHLDPDLALLNCGDDNVTMFSERSKKMAEAWYRPLEEGKLISPYFKHELESPVSFSGALLTRNQYGELHFIPNLKSMAVNWFVPERSAGSRAREAWFIGWLERSKYFMSAPRYSDVKETIDRVLYDNLKLNADVLAKAESQKWRAPIAALTAEDVAVIINPDTLAWKYDSAEISPEVDALFSASIPVELIEKIAPYMQ